MSPHLRRPFITGAGRGIGRAFVRDFLNAGAEVVYAAVRSEAAAQDLAREDVRVRPVVMDVTRQDQVTAAAAEAGDLTVLVNNAGVERNCRFLGAEDPAAARHEMEVNYFGVLNTSRAFVPTLVRNSGAMVNVLSVAAVAPILRVGSYSASKVAAWWLTQALRNELRAEPVKIYAVFAAGYDTDMADPVRGSGVTMFPPEMLTGEVIEALKTGNPQDIYPDPMSQHLSMLSLDEVRRMLGSAG